RSTPPSGACLTCFFFFQAEDGIRDLIVTGVQPCALPLSRPPLRARVPHPPVDQPEHGVADEPEPDDRPHGHEQPRLELGAHAERSEERRVGKEGRWGGAPDDEKGEQRTGEGVGSSEAWTP